MVIFRQRNKVKDIGYEFQIKSSLKYNPEENKEFLGKYIARIGKKYYHTVLIEYFKNRSKKVNRMRIICYDSKCKYKLESSEKKLIFKILNRLIHVFKKKEIKYKATKMFEPQPYLKEITSYNKKLTQKPKFVDREKPTNKHFKKKKASSKKIGGKKNGKTRKSKKNKKSKK